MRRDGNLGITTKSNITDLVTEADLASEKLIRARALRPQPILWLYGRREQGQPKRRVLLGCRSH